VDEDDVEVPVETQGPHVARQMLALGVQGSP
jgi:hypothetical protein